MCWGSLFISTTWALYVAKSVLALITNPTLTCVTASTWATPAPTVATAMPVSCCASTRHCLRQRLVGPLLDREGGCQHPPAAVTILTNSGQPTVSVPAASRSFSSRWRWRPSNPCPAPSWVCWRTDPWPGTGKNLVCYRFGSIAFWSSFASSPRPLVWCDIAGNAKRRFCPNGDLVRTHPR